MLLPPADPGEPHDHLTPSGYPDTQSIQRQKAQIVAGEAGKGGKPCAHQAA